MLHSGAEKAPNLGRPQPQPAPAEHPPPPQRTPRQTSHGERQPKNQVKKQVKSRSALDQNKVVLGVVFGSFSGRFQVIFRSLARSEGPPTRSFSGPSGHFQVPCQIGGSPNQVVFQVIFRSFSGHFQVDPISTRKRPENDPKSTRNRPDRNQAPTRKTRNRPKIDPIEIRRRPENDPKSTRNRPEVDPNSTRSFSRHDPKTARRPTRSRPEIDPIEMRSRPENDGRPGLGLLWAADLLKKNSSLTHTQSFSVTRVVHNCDGYLQCHGRGVSLRSRGAACLKTVSLCAKANLHGAL